MHAAGNVTKDTASGNGPYSYFYDADNKLTKVTKSGGDVATYEYDAQGRRIEFIDSVNTVTKLYYHEGGNDRVIEEYNGAGTPARQRYFVWGNYIDELLMYYEDGDTADYFVTHNHLFSPAALIGSTGTIQETYEYDAYGKPVIYTEDGATAGWWDGDETSATVSAKNLSYLFTGREFDSLDSGNLPLQYSRARNYDPETGRWLQRDPLNQTQPGGGYQDGMSLYQYVGSSPIIFTDMSGTKKGDKCWRRDRSPSSLTTIYFTSWGPSCPTKAAILTGITDGIDDKFDTLKICTEDQGCPGWLSKCKYTSKRSLNIIFPLYLQDHIYITVPVFGNVIYDCHFRFIGVVGFTCTAEKGKCT